MTHSLLGTATIEISSPEGISPKTLHLLRSRLAVALDEAAQTVLDSLGVVNENPVTVTLDDLDTDGVGDEDYQQQAID